MPLAFRVAAAPARDLTQPALVTAPPFGQDLAVMTPLSLALLGSLAFGAPASADVETGAEVRAQAEDSLGLLSLKVKRGDKTLKHPGHIMIKDEQVVLSLKQGDRVHEVTVFVEPTQGGFKFEVAYTDNGALVLSGETTAKPKQWVKIKSDSGKAWVELQLDPEKKRKDGVDIPDGNNPLDGL